jgi:Arc/MetJ-type ribon-helix-helix transcriptional regulator
LLVFDRHTQSPELKYNSSMKAISIKLPEPMLHRVMQHAMQKSINQSDVIRAALTAYLASDQAAEESAASQAARWAGLGKGPADLSTNPKHLKGFGQ